MKTTLATDLADSLNSYSVDVTHWQPGMGDAFIFLGNREFLQLHLSALTEGQRRALDIADRRVLELAA